MLNSTQEIWLPVNEFPFLYKVSNFGNVASHRKTLAQNKINSGYLTTTFKVDRVAQKRLVHRLVAEAFIPNPENKREVNHIDGNKLNNRLDNLEWVTSAENKAKAKETGLWVYNIPTLGLKLSGASKYHNVGYDDVRKKWKTAIRHNGKTYYQKRFDNEEDAARYVNWALDELQLFDRPRNIV